MFKKLVRKVKGLYSRGVLRKAIRNGVLPKDSNKHYRAVTKAGLTT